MNVKCSNCGIAFGSRCCPNCGLPAEQSMGYVKKKDNTKTVLTVLFSALALLIFATILININVAKSSNSKKIQVYNQESEIIAEPTQETSNNIEFGIEGKSEDLLLTVNKVGSKKEISENEFFVFKPDSGKYAIVNITIENTGKKSNSLTSGYFKLISQDEAEYNPTLLLGLSNKYISFESINPGLEVTGNLVFEIPDSLDVTEMTLRFSGSDLFSESVSFNLK